MEEIKKQIEEYQYYELTEEEQSKLHGQPFPGAAVKIKFKKREIADKGYLFQLPEQDEDSDVLDFMVHVPHPDNSDGIDEAPPVWVHLVSLLTNNQVKYIQIRAKEN